MSFANGTIGEIIKALDMSQVEMLAISLPDSRIIDATQFLVRRWDCTKYDLIGRQLSQAPESTLHARYIDVDLSGLGTQTTTRIEITFRPDGGESRVMRFKPQLFRDGKHEFLLLLGQSAQAAGNARVQEAEAKLELAVRAGGYAPWDYDFRTRQGSLAPEIKAMLGLDGDWSLTFLDIDGRTHPDDTGKTVSARLKEFSGDTSYIHSHYRLRHEQGRFVWLEVIATLIKDPITAQPAKIIGLARDVTAEMEARHRIDTSERNLARSQAIANMGSWVHDLKTGVLTWSEHMPVVFGLDKSIVPLSSDALSDLVEPDYRQRWREAFRTAEKGEHVSLECGVRLASGEARRITLHIDPELGPDGRVVRLHGICHDVTEQILLERKYLQAQKMEAVGRLTGGIAHDFNNLLTVVLGNLQLAEQLSANDEPVAKRLRAAIDAVNKGAELTKRLLAFSREQTLGSDVLDLRTHLPGMQDMLARATGEGIRLEIVAKEPVWPVAADRTQLETAILNLAINGRDSMSDGGTLVVETSNAVLDQAYCQSHAEVTPGDYVMVAVTDSGHGIPKDIIDKVVQPFFTTKAPGDGSGLGLSMVYGFVKQSGGHLNIYSEEGSGTTVKIYLPRHHQEASSAAEADTGPAQAAEETEIVTAITEAKLESEPETGIAAPAEEIRPVEQAAKAAAKESDESVPAGIAAPETYTAPEAHAATPDARPVPSEAAAPTPEAAAPGKPVVLVVEDNDGVRDVAVAMVEEMGYEVLDASSGSEALKVLCERNDISLLLSDVVMAGMNGPELAIEALKLKPDLKVLFASGFAGDTLEEVHDLPQFIDLINKPFTREELTRKVRKAVGEARAA